VLARYWSTLRRGRALDLGDVQLKSDLRYRLSWLNLRWHRQSALRGSRSQGIFKYDASANSFTVLDDGLTNIQFYDLDVGMAGTIYLAPQDMAGFRKQGMNDW
jgi:hypothetical protein